MRSRIVGCLLMFSLLLPSTVLAGIRPWISIAGERSSYRMSDLNEDIAGQNALITVATSHKLDFFQSGMGAEVALGVELVRGLSLGVAIGQLRGSRTVSDTTAYSMKYDLGANTYRGFAQYAVHPSPAGDLHFGVSVGSISSGGSFTNRMPGATTRSGDATGSALMFEEYFGGGWQILHGIGMSAEAGYRYAHIDEFTVSGSTVYVAPDRKEALDYSGVFVRAGLNFGLGR